jgi:hypothetical protein
VNKLKVTILISVLLLFASSFAMLASATDNEGSLASGYAVTNNYHGLTVPMGANVVVTAQQTQL